MRINTIKSISEIVTYDDGYGLYQMDVNYDYDLDRIIRRGITDDQSAADAIRKEALPFIPVKIKVPKFACTAFSMPIADMHRTMGRNYDFKNDTSAMLVRCHPKNGYSSIAFAALDNIRANDPVSLRSKMACLTAPFICLDGINEKGVSVAVLTLDSKPTRQKNPDKQTISTSLAIRLILDKADSTEKAVEILRKYNMYAISGRDYHFFVTDASGDSRVIEYDCDDETRKTVVTPSDAVTNFFIMHGNKVLPNQKNGVYGHGKERYDTAVSILEKVNEKGTEDDAWEILRRTSQLPSPNDVTSNTQWSILFDNTALTATISLRRHWQDRFVCNLLSDEVTKSNP